MVMDPEALFVLEIRSVGVGGARAMERSCGVCEPVRRRENCADEAQSVCGLGRERSRPGFSRRRDSAGAAGKRGTAFFAGPGDSGPYGRGGAERAGGDGVEERSWPAARDMAGAGAGGGGGRALAVGGRASAVAEYRGSRGNPESARSAPRGLGDGRYRYGERNIRPEE